MYRSVSGLILQVLYKAIHIIKGRHVVLEGHFKNVGQVVLVLGQVVMIPT